jgi:hypothetical protein
VGGRRVRHPQRLGLPLEEWGGKRGREKDAARLECNEAWAGRGFGPNKEYLFSNNACKPQLGPKDVNWQLRQRE